MEGRGKPTQAWAGRYGDVYSLAMEFLDDSEAEEEQQRKDKERDQERELEQARALAEAQKNRAEEQAKAASRLKKLAGFIGVLLVVAVVIAAYAVKQQVTAENATRKADEQSRVALRRLARYFSVEASNVKTNPNLRALLSLEAAKAAFIPASETALRDAIRHNLVTPLRWPNTKTRSLASDLAPMASCLPAEVGITPCACGPWPRPPPNPGCCVAMKTRFTVSRSAPMASCWPVEAGITPCACGP